MIKALHLRSSFDPGGTETVLLRLFNYKQVNLKLYYALLSKGIYNTKLVSENNISIEKIRKSKFDFNIVSFTISYLKKNKIKIVHTHQPIELIYGVLIKLFMPSIKLFHSIHLYNPKDNWVFYLERYLVRFTHKTFVMSESLKKKLENRNYKKNLDVLYNAVLTEPIEKDQSIKNHRKFEKLIDYSDSDKIIGMIGNFVPEKDQATVIKAFTKYLAKNDPSLKLVLIGNNASLDESFYSEFKSEKYYNKVYFTGSLDNASQYLNYFQIFIMSSTAETFGNVVFEAMLNKIPVIASDIDVFRETSKNGKYYKLFKMGDDADLAKNIFRVLEENNNSENQLMITKSYEYVIDNFSFEKYLQNLISFYTS